MNKWDTVYLVSILNFGSMIYRRGWDEWAITSDGLPSLLWIFGVVLAFLLIPNLFARLGGASIPLFGGDNDEPRRWKQNWLGPLAVLFALAVLAFLRPPGETENGWFGLFSVIGICVSVIALGWLYWLVTHKLLFPTSGTNRVAGHAERLEGQK